MMRYQLLSRQWLPVALLMTTSVMAKAQAGREKPFTLKGQITAPQHPAKLYFTYEAAKKQLVKDSVLLQKDGRFTFKGKISHPVLARIYMNPEGGKYTLRRFYLQPGKIEISSNGALDSATVKGSNDTPVFDEFVAHGNQYNDVFATLRTRAYYNRGMQDSVEAIEAEQEKVRHQFNKEVTEIIRQHPDSYASWDMLEGFRIAIDPNTITPMFEALSPKFKNSEEGKAMLQQIENARKIMVGAPAPNFTQNDVSGNPVSLTSFRGKYVLIDFWASWCGICRAENPNVLRAYNAYKDKGFTVLGVSLDDSLHRDDWVKAIKDDNMPWQQISDLKRGNNEAAVLYGIKGIPQNVLVDPNGIIIAKNKRNKELMGTLMAIFDKGYNLRMNGEVKADHAESIVFKYSRDDAYRYDTVAIRDGKFTWLSVMQEPQRVDATILPQNKRFDFFSDIGYLELKVNIDSLPDISLKGSDVQDEAKRFYAAARELSPEQKELLQQLTDATAEDRPRIGEALLNLSRSRYNTNVKKYVAAHPYSLFSLQLIRAKAEDFSGPKYDTVFPLFSSLPQVIQGTPSGRKIAAMLPELKKSAKGTMIADLSQADTSGQQVSLRSFKGKYVLIDFWASWCHPCRAENPNLLKAYNKFKSKGFTIVGISLDDIEHKWKKAIQDDQLPWTQLSDLKGRNNEIAKYYNVRGIPWNILIDREGKIIAKDLRGVALDEQLEQLIQ